MKLLTWWTYVYLWLNFHWKTDGGSKVFITDSPWSKNNTCSTDLHFTWFDNNKVAIIRVINISGNLGTLKDRWNFWTFGIKFYKSTIIQDRNKTLRHVLEFFPNIKLGLLRIAIIIIIFGCLGTLQDRWNIWTFGIKVYNKHNNTFELYNVHNKLSLYNISHFIIHCSSSSNTLSNYLPSNFPLNWYIKFQDNAFHIRLKHCLHKPQLFIHKISNFTRCWVIPLKLMVSLYNYNQRNVKVLEELKEIHDQRGRFKEVEEQKQRENEQVKHMGGKYETISHSLTCRCMINANYHVLPSLRHCAPPSSPPTGPSTGLPTSPPTGPSTGSPTSPPTGPSTGSPTSPRGAYTVYRPYADGMELLETQRRNDE